MNLSSHLRLHTIEHAKQNKTLYLRSCQLFSVQRYSQYQCAAQNTQYWEVLSPYKKFQVVSTKLTCDQIGDGSQFQICKFEYQNQATTESCSADVHMYTPLTANNRHLIIIANGSQVGAGEYKALSERLVDLGYTIMILDYVVDRRLLQLSEKEYIDKPPTTTMPEINLVQATLRYLVNNDSVSNGVSANFTNLYFNDVVVLGHSFGGAIAMIHTILWINKDIVWDTYLKGILLFEGWGDELPVPFKKFVIAISSKYKLDNIQKWRNSLGENKDVGLYAIDKANHFLITNYYNKQQVTPFARVATNQEDFTTSQKEWETGQKLFVQIVDAEIQSRIGSEQEAIKARNTLITLRLYNQLLL
eukprot:TRINITY_DN757_c1_g1_i6.p1 TRINITY_DN757_c1_g1~~TRINITY_DN757_c1_g1_i6.p1  ORF type:complete len:360 (+),score=12.82 TRINITY_DN757_c1_g1_i6:84-1163(+)